MGNLGIHLTYFSFLESGLLPSQLVSQFNPSIIELLEVRLNSIAALRTVFGGGGGKGLELPQLKKLGLYIDSTLAKLAAPVDQRSAALKFPELMNLRLFGKGRVMRDCTSHISLESIKQLSLGEDVDASNNYTTMFTGLDTLQLCVNIIDVLHEKVWYKHWVQNFLSSKIYAKGLVIDGEDLNGSKITELSRIVYTLQHCIMARVTILVVPSIIQLHDL
ncbi:hypothetical protein EC988_001105 [Linderina pennispora]|nr:hypothetical protein EC988_001105 [Linderina pennispora]